MIIVLRKPTSRSVGQGVLAPLASFIGALVINSATARIKDGGLGKLPESKSPGALVQEPVEKRISAGTTH